MNTFKRIFVIALMSIAFVNLSFAEENIVIDLSSHAFLKRNSSFYQGGKDYFGVALGGGNKTFLSYKYYNTLNKISPDAIRLEAITADYRKLYDPHTKLWNYSLLDEEIENMNAGKRTIIANVFYTPKFLSSCPDSKFYAYCIPNDINAWISYVSNIVTHVYHKYGIKYWEIGNEPSGKLFFKSSMSNFFDFYILTADAIKRVDKNINVGGFADNIFYLKSYSDFFSKIQSRNPTLLDFVTFHWYGDWGVDKNSKYNPEYVFTLSNKLKKVMSKYGFSKKEIFLTEWNLVGNNPAPHGKAQVNSFYVASLFWIIKSDINKSLFFRVEPYNKTNSSLINSSGDKNDVGDIFSILNNLHFSNMIMKSDVYLFFSGLNKEIVLSNYDLVDTNPKKVTIHIGRASEEKCNRKYTATLYSNVNAINKMGYVDCVSNDAYLHVILNDFDVMYIKY